MQAATEPTARWFTAPGTRADATCQLYCLPYAGAGAGAFRQWPRVFPPAIDVQLVQLPGREHRIAEPPEFDAAEVAAVIAARADRPYAIYGHSMGARLGFLVVRELRRRGGRLPVRLYVGGARPPDDRDLLAIAADLPEEQFVQRLREVGGMPEEVLDEPELRELMLPILRADLRWLDVYQHTPEPPLPVPIVAFAGSRDPELASGTVDGWQRHTAGPFRLHTIDGGHFFLDDDRDTLVRLVSTDLLDAVGTATTGRS